MVQASNIWPRNQVICMNDERLRRELGDDTTKQISSNFTTVSTSVYYCNEI